MDSTIAALLLASWLGYAIASLLLVSYFSYDWKRHTMRRPQQPKLRLPNATVILPIKGASPNLRAILDAFSCLDYPKYELLLAIEAKDDPASVEAMRLSKAMPDRVRVVIAGRTTSGSQKIANQLAAWRVLGSDTEIVCFADADAVPPADWLSCLVDWISIAPDRALVSGYRWLLPGDQTLATLFACVINNAIAMAPRDRRWNLAWGGAMAAHRDFLHRLDLTAILQGVASDDLVLGKAVRCNGGYVEQIRDLLIPSPVSYQWGELIEFLRRQYTMLWLYARKHWFFAAITTTLASAAWIAALCLALSGNGYGWVILLAVYCVDIVKTYKRSRFALDKWPGQTRCQPFNHRIWAEALATPVITMFHAACILSTIHRQQFSWAGVDYDARTPHRVISTHPQQKNSRTPLP